MAGQSVPCKLFSHGQTHQSHPTPCISLAQPMPHNGIRPAFLPSTMAPLYQAGSACPWEQVYFPFSGLLQVNHLCALPQFAYPQVQSQRGMFFCSL
jgi:hypothetical protein